MSSSLGVVASVPDQKKDGVGGMVSFQICLMIGATFSKGVAHFDANSTLGFLALGVLDENKKASLKESETLLA